MLKTYCIRNWHEYNNFLINRGSINFWIHEEVLQEWQKKPTTETREYPKKFTDLFIESILTVRYVFHLTLRGTQSFMCSLMEWNQ